MTARAVSIPLGTASEARLVLVCRDAARRRLVGRYVSLLEVHGTAGEAILALSRAAPRAVVIDLADFRGQVEAVVRAARRGRPGTPIYLVVDVSDEPLAHRLVRDGDVTDYLVGPDELRRFGQAMARGEPWPPAAEVPVETQAYLASSTGRAGTEAPPPADGMRRYFEAACALADLAPLDRSVILRQGSRTILEAAGTGRGCAFLWNAGTGRLETALCVGPPAEPTDDERATVQRAVRTGETLVLQVRGDAGMCRLLCIPVRGAHEVLGAICLSGPAEGPAQPDAEAIEALTRALGRLAIAAERRA